MTSHLDMAVPEAFVDCRARQGEATSVPPVIARLWTEHRRSDDRLLADIGPGAEDLGLTERWVRRRPASHKYSWEVSK